MSQKNILDSINMTTGNTIDQNSSQQLRRGERSLKFGKDSGLVLFSGSTQDHQTQKVQDSLLLNSTHEEDSNFFKLTPMQSTHHAFIPTSSQMLFSHNEKT